jgi:hypothetical protein
MQGDTVWKNSLFSNTPTKDASHNIQERDIYKDYNYKNIRPINNILNEKFTDHSNFRPRKEGFDSSVFDVDDLPDEVQTNENEIHLDDLDEKPKFFNDEAKKKFYMADLSNINLAGMFEMNEEQSYVYDIEQIVASIETAAQNLTVPAFNLDKIYQIMGLAQSVPARVIDRTIVLFGNLYIDFVNKLQGKKKALNKKSSEYDNLNNAVVQQMRNLFSLLVAFWIVLNWWFIFNYHHHFISFAQLFDIEFVKIFLESLLMFTNLINYLLIGFKQDEQRFPFAESICKFLWDIRPLSFSIFFVMVQQIYMSKRAEIERAFMDAISRKSNGVSGFNTTCVIFSYLKMDLMNPVRMGYRIAMLGLLGGVFALLLKLLLLLALLPLGVSFAYLYLVFHSFFAIIAYKGIYMFDMISAMFIDLQSTLPDSKDENESMFSKLFRFYVNSAVPINLFIILIAILGHNIDVVSKVNDTSSTKDSLIAVSYVALFVGIAGLGILLYNLMPINYITMTNDNSAK